MANAPVDVLKFNTEGDTKAYKSFISELRGKLAGKGGKKIKDKPVLGAQTGEDNPPQRWIHVQLRPGHENPRVAIRSDNGYIVGFTNSNGNWFQLKKKDKGATKILLPNATVLSFSGDYEALIGSATANLPLLPLGIAATVSSVSVLGGHKKDAKPRVADVEQARGDDDIANDDNDVAGDDDAIVTGFANDDNDDVAGNQHIGDLDATIITLANNPDRSLRRAVATLAVTLCEAARLIPVHDTIAKDWASEHGASIAVKEVNYIQKWGQLSQALLGWDADGFKNNEKWFRYLKDSTGISTGDGALKVMQLILNNPPKPKNGRADVEEGDPTGAGEE